MSNIMEILIPATDQRNYKDLQVLLTSIRAYVEEPNITIGYSGENPSWHLDSTALGNANLIPRRTGYDSYGLACKQLIQETTSEELFILNDDTVFTPSTWKLLVEDIEDLKKKGTMVGLVGPRSNWIAGCQNIRAQIAENVDRFPPGIQFPSEGYVVELPQIFGVGFYVTRTALNSISNDWTNLNWYSDNLLSYDLAQKGYKHFMSRSYLHHHGSQTTGMDYAKLDREGKDWLKKNRPDFYKLLG